MTHPALSRDPGRAGPPVRLLHLGLGNFFRAHQAFYTDRAADGAAWPIAAFTGRQQGTTELLRRLQAQNGLYTLLERGPERDRPQVIESLHHAHAAADNESWLGYWRSPRLSAVTLTITEAGYSPGSLIEADLAILRADPLAGVSTALGRLLAGLLARRGADAGPVSLVPCDNLPGNGDVLRRAIGELAEQLDPQLPQWVSQSVSVVSTMVDRITPRVTDADVATVARTAAYSDGCPVVTEPFHEWVLSGSFPAGRPQWETAGATFAVDVAPYENRKLWLLNGAHSLLAYTGLIRGHTTVAEAAGDDTCIDWVTQWWGVASPYLRQPEAELAAYRAALLQRFSNGRMRDRLDRIAVDGSQKLPVRVIPVLLAEREAGRLPTAATRVLAAWIAHLRGAPGMVADVARDELLVLADGPMMPAVKSILEYLRPGLGDDSELVAVVTTQCRELRA